MKANIRIAFIALIVMSAAVFANAQTIEKRSLTIEGAKKVIAGAVAYAKKNNAPGGVIAVVDEGGNLMALERLDGTFAAGANISIGKARTAVLFKRPTKAFEDIIKNGRTAMVALPDAFFTPLQGGVPITVDGQIVGGVGVSGAASAQQDEELAIAGANMLSEAKMSGMSQANKPEALFFDATQVSTSFSAGAVLLDGNDRNYMVHTSRRDKPGLAEIHTLDTDIIYVMEGKATFVTGGTVADAKEIAPDELRGARIEGGLTRQLAKGQVIIVPNNTPHWFKEVNGEFLYYTIKVR
ncbi:MAG TPA: heme-binding protein [Pyrinomonadaceae bacterium]|jgi:glc operon protein GlcG|nr:heme-binding protein [Pyrinomonadaceae bacterium]